ncbi:putative Nudix hydrolase P35G2.12 [Hypsizygus marmoreus]|uniref:Nudix hydrolase P35G2.12 n=1 Tax=Hypsizygus marmoreus TaxID=39966 RepID=A0A369JJ34_HYPMA|nr:putative Nudix hydrolase P35G2.12 [Hypsizygus marmoreus]
MTSIPKVISSAEMSAAEAKWITLKKIKYIDAAGHERVWESAERKTRKASGVDAVDVLAILRSKTNAFPLSTVIIEQYRPAIDKFIIELPAGLVDEGETPEQAAFRELEEETGYKADSLVELSPVIVSDPGMTNANMQLVVLNVILADQMETPKQKLDAGEFIVTRVVELSKLNDELKGKELGLFRETFDQTCFAEYSNRGYIADARLSHFASGYDLAQRISSTGI